MRNGEFLFRWSSNLSLHIKHTLVLTTIKLTGLPDQKTNFPVSPTPCDLSHRAAEWAERCAFSAMAAREAARILNYPLKYLLAGSPKSLFSEVFFYRNLHGVPGVLKQPGIV